MAGLGGGFKNIKSSGGPKPSMGIQEIMPFVQQNALLSAMQPRAQMAQQTTAANPSIQDQLTSGNVPADQQSNFKTVPKVSNVNGTLVSHPEVVEKQDAPAQAADTLAKMNSHAATLNDLAMKVISNPGLQKQMGPMHPSAYSGPVGNAAMGIRGLLEQNGLDKSNSSGDFAEAKAQAESVKLDLRKDLEGLRLVTGGLPLISPILGSMSDVPHQFVGKTIGTAEAMQRNHDMIVGWLKGQNYKSAGVDAPFPIDPLALRKAAHDSGMPISEHGYSTTPESQGNNAKAPGQSDQSGGLPHQEQAPKGAVGWSKSKQSWVDMSGNPVK